MLRRTFLKLTGGAMTGLVAVIGDPGELHSGATENHADAQSDRTTESGARGTFAAMRARLRPTSWTHEVRVNAGTAIAAASGGQVLPQRTLHLASKPGFPQSGSIIIDSGSGPTVVHYTGIARDGTRITGCSGGSGRLAVGDTVRPVSNVAAIAAVSDGRSLPQEDIYVSSNKGMPFSGTVVVATSDGPQLVSYSGLSGTDAVTGCVGGTGTMSNGGTVTVPYCATIGSGIKTLRDLQNAPYGQGFDPGPQWRGRVLVDPGTYNESFTIPPFVDLMGTSGDPADVQVTFAVTTLPVITVVGTSYIADITSVCTGTGKSGGYNQPAWDLTNLDGPVTVALDNCVGVSTNPHQRALDSYNNSDQFVGYFNCSFSQGQRDDVDYGMPYAYPVEIEFSLHQGGSSAPRSGPSLQVFYNCTVTKTGTFDEQDPAPLHVADIGSGQKDVFIWVSGPNGRINKGVCPDQINIAGVPFRGAIGYKSQYIVDPAVKEISFVTDVSNAPRRLTRKVTSPLPLPLHGMTQATRGFYYPSALREARTITVPTAAINTGELVANRLYFIPFHIDNAMNLAKILAYVATGATGNLGAAFYVADQGRTGLWTSPPVVSYGRLSRPQSSVNDANVMTMNLAAPRTVFPGMGQAWIALVSDSALPTFYVSKPNGTSEQCYFQQLSPGWQTPPPTASPVALPAGSVIPRVGLTTA